MHKYQLLRQRAEEFRVVLEEYAKKDPDVDDLLERWMPWYERIQRREVRLPCYEYSLGQYFSNPDLSPIAERYSYSNPNNPLNRANTSFDAAILDWLSQDWYLNRLKAAGELPDLIPDELPPPEEETPLARDESEPEAKQTRKGWLHRWVFGEKK